MVSLSSSGFLRIGASDLEYRMIGPAPDEAPAIVMLHEALKEHVKQKIGPWKYPRWIDVVDSLPKTATGKIQRFKLREWES